MRRQFPRKTYLVEAHELVGRIVVGCVEARAVEGNGAVEDERREQLHTIMGTGDETKRCKAHKHGPRFALARSSPFLRSEESRRL